MEITLYAKSARQAPIDVACLFLLDVNILIHLVYYCLFYETYTIFMNVSMERWMDSEMIDCMSKYKQNITMKL